jgi:dihydrofolate reductase
VGFAAAWPGREETEGEFAVRMNSLKKFVVSRSLKEPLEWNGTLLKGDVAEEVGKLKQEAGQDILVYGSGQLVNSLMAHNLIDVYRLMVHPIVLGKGDPLFRQGAALRSFKLTDSKTTDTGVIMLTYEPVD